MTGAEVGTGDGVICDAIPFDSLAAEAGEPAPQAPTIPISIPDPIPISIPNPIPIAPQATPNPIPIPISIAPSGASHAII